jgi:hypothetical protein
MSIEAHHRAALIDTAGLELNRAHQAAVAMNAGEIRRALRIALSSLRSASGDDPSEPISGWISTLDRALTDLDGGALSEMATLIETVRRDIDASDLGSVST